MELDMRALYYIQLNTEAIDNGAQISNETIKANENCLNQNFTIITQAIADISSRLSALENN